MSTMATQPGSVLEGGAAARGRGRGRRLAAAWYQWLAQVVDPVRAARGLRGVSWYLSDLARYRRMAGAEPLRLGDLQPAVHERTAGHELDAHYFYVNAWAARQVLAAGPARHVDVGSQVGLAALLGAALPVIYVDYRPLNVRLSGLASVGADILRLPFRSGSVRSLSCLHVAEHIGLGRYGDALDPAGTRKATAELARVLAPGGNLYFALPVGRPRVCFNAHRVHSVAGVLEYLPGLRLVGLAGVDDRGSYCERAEPAWLDANEYGCGMFHFAKAPA